MLVLIGAARATDADSAYNFVVDLDEDRASAAAVVWIGCDFVGQRLVGLDLIGGWPEDSLNATAACALKLLFWTARGPVPSQTSTAFSTPTEPITLTAIFGRRLCLPRSPPDPPQRQRREQARELAAAADFVARRRPPAAAQEQGPERLVIERRWSSPKITMMQSLVFLCCGSFQWWLMQ